jgi:hypothetical protein
MKRFILVAMVAAAMVAAPKAEAAFITGGVSITGDAQPSGGSNWGTATGVSFGPGPIIVSGTTGDFTTEGVPLGTAVTFTNFTFSPSLSPSPVNPLWTFTCSVGTCAGKTFQFVMNTVNVVNQGAGAIGGFTFSFVNLVGTGVLSISGYTPTPGTFSFGGSETNSNFSFSSNYTAAQVPEPGTMILFGTGLLGLAAVARRRLMNKA